MKKYISFLLTSLLSISLLTSCGSAPAQNDAETKANETSAPSDNTETDAAETEGSVAPEKISIVTTIFPQYDWVKQIIGDSDTADVTMLLDKGVDLHSYQPTADDLIKVADCDLFIYVGGESDEWVLDALAEATNPDMKVINLLEALGDSVKEEELVEGMEGEEEEEEEEEEEGPEYDEHVWLSLKNAKVLSQVIADCLSEICPEQADTYQANCQAYVSALDALDASYDEAVKAGSKDTVLFGDRFPFRYLVDDYGLNYYAAFVGCSAESEASFETILFLAEKIDELGLSKVMQIESADGRIAQTVIDTSKDKNREILTIDSMQSVTAKDVEAGASYLSIMEKNLEVLKAAVE